MGLAHIQVESVVPQIYRNPNLPVLRVGLQVAEPGVLIQVLLLDCSQEQQALAELLIHY